MVKASELPTTYPTLLSELKNRIRTARLKAALAVNSAMVLLYWSIGRDLLEKKRVEHWGTKMIERLSRDLRSEFPDNRGFSRRNLFYMQMFAEAYPDERLVQAVPALITWTHNCTILDKVKEAYKREWYVQQTVENGWSYNVLAMQIDRGLYERQGNALTNFSKTLPKPDSNHAQQVVKNSYSFDFLDTSKEMRERRIERGLVDNICAFIMELGKGFAFLGSQYHLEIGGEDYYIDLLFYHIKLRRFVVIDIKAGKFKPAYAGQLNFYLSAVDDMLRHPDDKQSIGIILCKINSSIAVEYALRGMTQPMAVAEYLPTSDELTARYHAALEAAQQSEPEPKPKTRKPRK